MASKSHWQAPGAADGDAMSADSGEPGCEDSGAPGGGDGAFLLNVRLCLIAFLNNVRRANSLRDAALQMANEATTMTYRLDIEAELTEDYLSC